MYNKSGAVVYIFIYALIFLGFIGTMYIIFNQAVNNYYKPVLESSELNFSEEDKTEAYKFEGIWKVIPIFFVILGFSFILYKLYIE